MLAMPEVRAFAEDQVPIYRRGAQAAAVAVGVFATAALANRGWRGTGLGGVEAHTAWALLAAATAVLLLGTCADGARGAGLAGRRALGYGAAAATLLLGVANGPRWMPPLGLAPQAGAWALCFGLLGVSLLGKAHWPRLAVSADMFVGFVGLAVILDHLFGVPTSAKAVAHPLHLAGGLALFALCAAWMAAFPRQRPVAYFLEKGSAATVLRRVLPITLLFPVLLVGLTAVERHTRGTAMQLATWVLLLSVVAFGVAMLWLIAHSLDRMDALRGAAERELRSSEARHRLLFENNPQPMWVYDTESLRFIAVNASACRVYGYSAEEFLAMTALDVRRAGEFEAVRREIAAAEGRASNIRQHFTKEGRPLEVEISIHAVAWQGRPAAVAYGHDITARRLAEAQLRESEAQVRTLLESTVEGIYAVNLEGNCIWCNPAAIRLLGFQNTDDLLGKNVHHLIHHTRPDGSPYPAETCGLRQATQQGMTFAATEEITWRADGTSFPADCHSSPLVRDGRVEGSVVTFADVTERVSLQSQFQQAQKMEAVGRLAAGIAHDFNNLLTVINGYTEILLRRPDGPDSRGKISNIRKAGERAAGLTQQLLAFSRQQVLQPQVLDLNAVLAETDPLLRRILGEDLTLVTELAPTLAPVRADPGQISQVLMNLVVNARDAMPDGGQLTIESANVELDAHYAASHPGVVPGLYVMLAVTDTGTGMDAHTLAHVFEPFFTTKPVGQGTGLGLATVFGIVRQSGGSVSIYSEPGRGTSLKVYLPRLVGASATGAAASPAPQPSPGEETVLVVEDEDSVRELVREVLADHGYTVLAAEGPQAALALAEGHAARIDLMITDVVMPQMDGRKLAARLALRRPEMAVLFISGYPDKAISHHGNLEAGLSFIQKPFTPAGLTRKVRSVLDAARAHPLQVAG